MQKMGPHGWFWEQRSQPVLRELTIWKEDHAPSHPLLLPDSSLLGLLLVTLSPGKNFVLHFPLTIHMLQHSIGSVEAASELTTPCFHRAH